MMIAMLLAVTLSAAIKEHPLYPVLVQYDREIAALRSTENVPGLRTIATSVRRDSDAMQASTANASRRAQSMSAGSGSAYRAREQAYLSGMQSRQIPQQDAASYRSGAARSAQSTLTAYENAMAQRTLRALDARAQQFREKESTLAFDLEKSHAGQRLVLQLQLRDLHLDKAKRAALQAKLYALDASVDAAVQARRRSDDARLADYAAQLHAQQNADEARMARSVAHATSANVAQRMHITESLPPEAAALRGYDPAAGASSVGAAIADAGSDLHGRFAQLQSVDRSSRTDTDARIAALERQRAQLYAAIVSDIRCRHEGSRRNAVKARSCTSASASWHALR